VRVRVRFRYNAETGDVETFVVEDLGGAERAADHDARHDRVSADVARVVERDALIEEVLPGREPVHEEMLPGREPVRVEGPPAEDVGSERTDRRLSE
jgi:FtsH ternary system domain X3